MALEKEKEQQFKIEANIKTNRLLIWEKLYQLRKLINALVHL